ncbi:MAG: N-acetyl-gamma-glutamyl-phosphate reductase [Saprospiraceae bacterium]|jgi:N-acetyl-gamma-glutamyl-phosphate reductase
MKKLKVGIIGGTGYTGVELLRLLAQHPQSEVVCITSRSEKGKQVSELYPSLRGHYNLAYSEPSEDTFAACDVVFAATPNGVAMNYAKQLLADNVKLIDFSADFRIADVNTWSKWYGMQHACPELLEQAVYALPEINREDIKSANIVANPGCYPTSVQLGYAPLLANGLIETDSLIADCKSGISGAGRGASVTGLFSEVSESVKAYAASGHRHQPEIEQGLSRIAGEQVSLTFVPHLMPMIRGIHATLYARLKTTEVDLQALYEAHYANEPFVDVMPAGSHPDTKSVRGTNMCRIAVYHLEASNQALVLSVEDNLVKGAAGQAIQNMNILFGLEETMGLNLPALVP